MLPPIYRNFRIYFKKDFIQDEVRDIFNPFLFRKYSQYEDIVDYINQSIISSDFPGFSDTGKKKKKFDKGRTKEYQGGLPVKEYFGKSLPITFRFTDYYLNYMVLYVAMIKHVDRKQKGDRIFLPDIHCQIMDDEDNIYLEFVYKNIKFEKIDQISLSKQNNSILNTQFNMEFKFNDFEVEFLSDNLQSSRNSKWHEFDYLNKLV